MRRKENIEERHEEQRTREEERETHIIEWWKRDIARMMREREQDPN